MRKFVMACMIAFAAMIVFTNQALFAQDQAVDVVTLMNGNQMNGKVTGISDDAITFVHQGETLSYTVKKAEINKIQFASGRIEIINEVKDPEPAQGYSSATPEVQRNLVAVLPFTYTGKGGERDDKLSKKVQSDCYNQLLKMAPRFTIQDPLRTNAMLVKHGVNAENIEGFMPDELCHILGAEYVVIGSILVDSKGVTNYNNSSTQAKQSADNRKTNVFNSGSSSSVEQFETQVDLKIYSQDGNNISSQSRRSFWQTSDAYQITLQYLLKRTPLYSK